ISLCKRRDRPRGRSAAKHRDELASPHAHPSSDLEPTHYHPIAEERRCASQQKLRANVADGSGADITYLLSNVRLTPRKRTSRLRLEVAALCHKPTHAPQQMTPRSSTPSTKLRSSSKAGGAITSFNARLRDELLNGALDVAVLPRTAPLDVGSLGAESGDPSLDGLGDELGSIIGPDMPGDAPQDEEVR